MRAKGLRSTMTIQAGFRSFSRRNAQPNGAKGLPKFTVFDTGAIYSGSVGTYMGRY